MKILFYGDSITDANRDRSDPKNLGDGFPRYAAADLDSRFPDRKFSYCNLGIGGDETGDLVSRMEEDLKDAKPDLVVLLIGVNDVWHKVRLSQEARFDEIEHHLLKILGAIKKTGAKLLLLEPFLIANSFWEPLLRPGLAQLNEVERRLAKTYADAFLPLDELLAEESRRTAPELLSEDGVHPAEAGRKIIGKLVAKQIAMQICNA